MSSQPADNTGPGDRCEPEDYRRLNRQLNAIFESSSDGIWLCDGGGRILKINAASEKLNGIQAADLVGQNLKDVVQSGFMDRSVTLDVLATGRRVDMLQYVSKIDKYLLVTGTPVFDEQGRISLVVTNERDMTQLNSIREQLHQSRMTTEKYRDELAQLSMLEVKKQAIVAESQSLRQMLKTAVKLARLEVSNILLLGESGSGKGLLAKFMHRSGRRNGRSFIQINCAALPESLLEAELFGYEKGAFTGAREKGKAGLFELAQDGTLFLDEIGDLPLTIQAKLLKCLDDREVWHLGGLQPIPINCIIIAATNREIEKLVRQRKFRQDLYYRLNAFPLKIPPLRNRVQDIYALINHFLSEYNHTYGFNKRISAPALTALQAYPFPGNVRELKNVIKNAVVMAEGELLDDFILESLGKTDQNLCPLPAGTPVRVRNLASHLESAERDILQEALEQCPTTRTMARYLGISQPSVVRKLRKYGLSSASRK